MKVMTQSMSPTFTAPWSRISLFGFCLLTLTCIVQDSQQQCLTRDDSRLYTNPTGHQSLYKGQHDFSLALMREINQQSPTDNIFFSPYSTYHALLLAYFTASSQTERSLSSALRLGFSQDKVDTMQAYRYDKLKRSMISTSPDKSYEFNSVNRIYVAKDKAVRECMEDLFQEEIEKLDFKNNPDNALATINSWVEAQTQGMIKDLLPPGGVDASTNLVLVNAAYFKGMWEYKFDPSLTHKSVFYISPSQNTFVDMMTQEGTFNHDVSEILGAHILEIPYKNSSASMFIFLPPFANAAGGIENVLSKLNAQTFGEIVKEGNLDPKKASVSIPKFSLEQSIEMTPILEKIGVGDLFTDNSDLSTLTGAKNVSLGRAIHKARIEVTEEGTKAAAATVLFTFRSSRPADPAQFVCNHPFIYIIYDNQNKAILFSGIFRKPT